MKTTSCGCSVLVYDHSGEPVDPSTDPVLPRTNVTGSEFEVGAPTSEEEVERKKNRTKRAPNSPLAAVLESWLLSICHCRFLVVSSFSIFFQVMPGVSGIEDVLNGVETDGQLRGRHIVDVTEAVHSRGRSWELLERAFDDGNICVQMRNLLVLFHVDSKNLAHLCF